MSSILANNPNLTSADNNIRYLKSELRSVTFRDLLEKIEAVEAAIHNDNTADERQARMALEMSLEVFGSKMLKTNLMIYDATYEDIIRELKKNNFTDPYTSSQIKEFESSSRPIDNSFAAKAISYWKVFTQDPEFCDVAKNIRVRLESLFPENEHGTLRHVREKFLYLDLFHNDDEGLPNEQSIHAMEAINSMIKKNIPHRFEPPIDHVPTITGYDALEGNAKLHADKLLNALKNYQNVWSDVLVSQSRGFKEIYSDVMGDPEQGTVGLKSYHDNPYLDKLADQINLNPVLRFFRLNYVVQLAVDSKWKSFVNWFDQGTDKKLLPAFVAAVSIALMAPLATGVAAFAGLGFVAAIGVACLIPNLPSRWRQLQTFIARHTPGTARHNFFEHSRDLYHKTNQHTKDIKNVGIVAYTLLKQTFSMGQHKFDVFMSVLEKLFEEDKIALAEGRPTLFTHSFLKKTPNPMIAIRQQLYEGHFPDVALLDRIVSFNFRVDSEVMENCLNPIRKLDSESYKSIVDNLPKTIDADGTINFDLSINDSHMYYRYMLEKVTHSAHANVNYVDMVGNPNVSVDLGRAVERLSDKIVYNSGFFYVHRDCQLWTEIREAPTENYDFENMHAVPREWLNYLHGIVPFAMGENLQNAATAQLFVLNKLCQSYVQLQNTWEQYWAQSRDPENLRELNHWIREFDEAAGQVITFSAGFMHFPMHSKILRELGIKPNENGVTTINDVLTLMADKIYEFRSMKNVKKAVLPDSGHPQSALDTDVNMQTNLHERKIDVIRRSSALSFQVMYNKLVSTRNALDPYLKKNMDTIVSNNNNPRLGTIMERITQYGRDARASSAISYNARDTQTKIAQVMANSSNNTLGAPKNVKIAAEPLPEGAPMATNNIVPFENYRNHIKQLAS